MDRKTFHQTFGNAGPVVLPVIHVLNTDQAAENIRIAKAAGCYGVYLINHDFEKELLIPIVREIRSLFPDYWIGINFLAVTGKVAFPILGELQGSGVRIDSYWADDARIDERKTEAEQDEALEIDSIRRDSGWQGLYVGGTAFKKQREVDPALYGYSAQLACNHMDVVLTSGTATGCAADLEKIKIFRENCGEKALGIASGVTPENASNYAKDVDLFMVATGINHEGDFYNINPNRLTQLINETKK